MGGEGVPSGERVEEEEEVRVGVGMGAEEVRVGVEGREGVDGLVELDLGFTEDEGCGLDLREGEGEGDGEGEGEGDGLPVESLEEEGEDEEGVR